MSKDQFRVLSLRLDHIEGLVKSASGLLQTASDVVNGIYRACEEIDAQLGAMADDDAKS